MKQRRRIYYSAAQRAEIWDRWKAGESMSSIGRRFDRESSSVFSVLSPTGGCGSASKSDPIEWQSRWLNSLYNGTFARMLTGACRDPISPRNIRRIQYVISYRVGSRL